MIILAYDNYHMIIIPYDNYHMITLTPIQQPLIYILSKRADSARQYFNMFSLQRYYISYTRRKSLLKNTQNILVIRGWCDRHFDMFSLQNPHIF